MGKGTAGLQVKTFGPFVVKDEERGEVEAVIGKIGVPDRDGDVLLPGSVDPSTRVKLSSWGHDTVFQNAAPVGVGSVAEVGGDVVLRARFFTTTERGRESFATVKEMGADAEWSYGFQRAEAEIGDITPELRDAGARRAYSSVRIVEASPVLRPAGFGTGTLSVKAEQSLTERLQAVHEALFERNEAAGAEWWAREVFEDHIIVDSDGALLRVPYDIADGGGVTLRGTEAVPVEVEYREVEEEEPTETRSAEDQAFAKALRTLKSELGTTYAELADAMEVKEEEVPGILSGEVAPPDHASLRAIQERLPKPVPAMKAAEQESEEVAEQLKRFERNRTLADAMDREQELETELKAQKRLVAELKAERDEDAAYQAKMREEVAQFERTRRRVGAL